VAAQIRVTDDPDRRATTGSGHTRGSGSYLALVGEGAPPPTRFRVQLHLSGGGGFGVAHT